jgi:hypothetical protein
MRLPQDSLSASILLFMRYFSLPLNGEAAARIRRQAMLPEPGAPAGKAEAGTPRSREALAFAAAAALDKGVELSREALERYAAALSPEERARPEEQGHSGGGSGGGGGAFENGDGGASRGNADGNADGNGTGDRAAAEEGRKLKEALLRINGADPLLSLLNRLPGKSGHRWIVLPFIAGRGRAEYRVSLRILLDGDLPGETGSVALEITGKTDRRLFILSRDRDGSSRLTLGLWPRRSGRALTVLQKKLSRLLNIQAECILVRNEDEFRFTSESRNDGLPCISKEV